MRCADCGNPVHSHGMCGECGVQAFYHDSPADTARCPGTSTHVQAVTS